MKWFMPVLLLLLSVAAVFVLTAAVLAVNNPTISDTSRGETYSCLAPWDTVLNDASNFPGGEPPPDGESIAARCRAAGEDRFGMAVAFGSASGGATLLAAALAWRGFVKGPRYTGMAA